MIRKHRHWRSPLALVLVVLVVVAVACQPAPAPTTESQSAAGAAVVQAPAKLFLMVDVVQGSKNIPADQKAARSCVLSSRFPRNSEIVWRARVFDPATGDLMDDTALSKVEIALANGVDPIPMKFGPHPKDPPGEAYWTGSWVVPKDAPTGTLNYVVTATDANGRIGEFKPFSVTSSLLTILDEVYPDAPPKP